MGSFFELMPFTGFLLELDKREGIEEALVPVLLELPTQKRGFESISSHIDQLCVSFNRAGDSYGALTTATP